MVGGCRSLVCLVTAVAVLLSAPVSTGVPFPLGPPGQDDAGTGGDAGDTEHTATPLGEGTHEGQLVSHVDDQDWYRLAPGDATVIDITVTMERGVDVDLTDPEGSKRDAAKGLWQPGLTGFVEIARPNGTWILDLDDDRAEVETTNYTITVDYRETEMRTVTVTGEQLVTFHVADHGPGFTRTDGAIHLDHEKGERGMDTALNIFEAEGDGRVENWCAGAFIGSRNLGTQARLHGQGPTDLHAEVEADPTDTSVPVVRFPFAFAMEAGVHLWWGWAFSGPVSATLHVAYEGEAPTAEIRTAGQQAFLEADDFGGEGSAVQTGPYVSARNLSAEVPLDGPTNVVFVDALPPSYEQPTDARVGEDTARFTVEPPGEAPFTVEDDFRFQGPTWDDTGLCRGSPAPPGDWTVTLDHLEGLEGDRIRVAAASFPIPPSGLA